MHTIEQGSIRRRRRRHSAEFKAKAIEACRQPGMSIAAVAMARSVNANLLRRWITDAEAEEYPKQGKQKSPLPPVDTFIALPAPTKPQTTSPVQIEVRRGALSVIIQWPTSALHECTAWLREVLK